jgi:hypothetical protein
VRPVSPEKIHSTGRASRSKPKAGDFRMTDDSTILSDAELDQVSGGDNPYAPPHHTGYHGPISFEQHLPSYSSITPFRAGWTFAWAANA